MSKGAFLKRLLLKPPHFNCRCSQLLGWRMPNPSYCTRQDNWQKQDVRISIFIEILSEKRQRGRLNLPRKLAHKRENQWERLYMMVPDAVGNIETRPDSQKISWIENMPVHTWGGGCNIYSWDLTLLLLGLSASNLAHRYTTALGIKWEE